MLSISQDEVDGEDVVLEDEVVELGEEEVLLEVVHASRHPQAETGQSSTAGCVRKKENLSRSSPPTTPSTATPSQDLS